METNISISNTWVTQNSSKITLFHRNPSIIYILYKRMTLNAKFDNIFLLHYIFEIYDYNNVLIHQTLSIILFLRHDL